MRKLLLGAASALTLLGVASVANAQEGYVGLNYGSTEDVDFWALRGTGSWDLSETLGLQVDGDYTDYDIGGPSADVLGLTGHLFWDNDTYKVGGLFGYADGGNADITAWGIEGRFYPSDSLTIGGSYVDGSVDAGPFEIDTSSWGLNGNVLVSDNFRIDASFLGTEYSDAGGDVDTTTWRIGGEYLFANSPFSVVAGYETTDIDGLNGNIDTWTVGARYVWGGNLRDRERNSAPFDTALNMIGGQFAGVLLGVAGALSDDDYDDLESIFDELGDIGDFDESDYE